jgi:hypothetical protein
MGVVLPDEVAWILGLIGVNWPNIDEDELRKSATELRTLASDLLDHGNATKAEIEQMLQDNSMQSLDLFEELWNQIIAGHMPQLAEGFKAFAVALDVAAVVVTGMKVAAIVQLVALAAEVIADQAAAVVTFGASEALAAAQVAATRLIVKALEDQAVQAVENKLMAVVEGPIFAAIDKIGSDLAGKLLSSV